jgi:hypothetical protein
VQEQDCLGEILASFFLQNNLQLHQQRRIILCVDSVVLWKIINGEYVVLTQKIETRIFQRIFSLGIVWGGVNRYAIIPLIIALSPGHSDITRFRT